MRFRVLEGLPNRVKVTRELQRALLADEIESIRELARGRWPQ